LHVKNKRDVLVPEKTKPVRGDFWRKTVTRCRNFKRGRKRDPADLSRFGSNLNNPSPGLFQVEQ